MQEVMSAAAPELLDFSVSVDVKEEGESDDSLDHKHASQEERDDMKAEMSQPEFKEGVPPVPVPEESNHQQVQPAPRPDSPDVDGAVDELPHSDHVEEVDGLVEDAPNDDDQDQDLGNDAEEEQEDSTPLTVRRSTRTVRPPQRSDSPSESMRFQCMPYLGDGPFDGTPVFGHLTSR